MKAETFLEIAKKDLEAAKCLYDREMYPQAIFYLQQSVEKAAKSFALKMKMIEEGELKGRKGIGHNPLKIHKKIADEQRRKIERIRKGIEAIPELGNVNLIKLINADKQHEILNKSQEFLDYLNAEKVKENLIFLDNREIMDFIEELNKLESETKELSKKASSFSIPNEEFNKLKKDILDFLQVLYKYKPQEVEKARKDLDNLSLNLMERLLNLILHVIIDSYFIQISLLYLSIITFPHAVTARYPEDNLNPLEIYNRNLPLIQLFEGCVETLEKTLNRIEYVYRTIEEVDQNVIHRKIPR